MPVDKNILRDYIATANSGKYSTIEEVNAKFPEFSSYDSQLLKDYLATANSGKYSNLDDVISKFPEFEQEPLKKKDFQGFSQELPKPTMPSGEKFTQGVGLGVKPISSTASPSASKPPKSTTPLESIGEKTKVENLSDFNKKYNTNYTPAQMQGKQPVEIQPEDESFASELFQSAQRGSAMLGSMLANTPSFIYNVAAYPQNKIAELTGLPIGTSSAQIAETLGLPENEIANYYEQVVKDGQAKVQQKYDKSVTEYLFGDNPDYKKGFKLLSNQVVEAAPISLSMMMGNAAGIGAVGSTLGGGLVFGAGNMQDLEGANMSETAKVENALSKGLFEGIFEQFGVTKLGGVVSDVFKKQGAEAAANIAKEGFKDVYLPALKKYVGIGAEESLGEAATQFSQNMVTILSGENPNLNPMEGVADAALVGLGSSVAYSTPTAAAETLALSKKRKEIKEQQSKLQKIEEAVANPETTPETKAVLSNMANDINGSIADAYDESKNLYQNLSEEDRVELSQILTKKQELEIAAQDPNIDEEIKKEIGLQIEGIDDKINEISDRSAVESKPEEIKTDESGISQEAAPKGDTGVEVTEPVIEEGKEQVEIEETPTKEEITPEQIETGRQEVSAVKEGKVETANPIRLFKGLFGKRNLDGTHKSAHPNAKGVFSAVDEKVAERYKGEDGMGTFDIPAGTTMEVIRLAVRNVPMSKFREQETEAINASDAQIVKLITTDAKGAEEQYVIKDPALIEKMQKPEDVKQTKEQEDAVQKQTAGQVPVQPKAKNSSGDIGSRADDSRAKKSDIATDTDTEQSDKKADSTAEVDVAKKAGVSPKNLRNLYNVNRKLFGLDRVKSLASAVAMDRMIGAMAKRAGVTKAEMYGRLKFEEGDYKLLLKTPNALFQGTFEGQPASFITLPEGISIVDGWYSPIEKRLRETKVEKQSANKWLTSGLIGKGDEAIYTGVKGWLEGKNPQEQVSKKEILDWMKDNRVEIVEVVNGEKSAFERRNELIEFQNQLEEEGDYAGMDAIQRQIDDLTSDSMGRGATKFSQYQLEGEKENYKEVLVTLPSKGSLNDLRNFFNSKDRKGEDFDNLTRDEFLDLQNEYRKSKEFKSSHFEEPNILVHLRMNTRTDADGNKVLFLEEIQSDWGQEGKKKSFSKPANTQLINQLEKQKQDILDSSKSYQFLNSKTEGNLSKEVFDAIQQVATNMIDNPYSTNESRKERFLKDIGETLNYWESFDNSVPKMNQDELSKFYDIYIKELKNNDLKIKGYDISYRLASVENEIKEINEQIANAQEKIATPTAPFVTDTNAWTKLGLKMAMREAISQGADKIAWTTGEQQNERYDLSKQVDYIDYWRNENGTYGFSLPIEFAKPSELTASELENYLGKEVAKKIVDNSEPKIVVEDSLLTTSLAEEYFLQGKDVFYEIDGVKKGKIESFKQINELKYEYRKRIEFVGEIKYKEYPKESKPNRLQGDDLQVGGKGMKGFYDKIVPDVAKALVKELTGKQAEIGEANINTTLYKENVIDSDFTTQQSIDITPELKAQVQKGIPLFQSSMAGAKGAMQAMADGTYVVYALTDPNVSTPLHELAHVFEHYLTDSEKNAVMKAAGTKEWNIQTSEFFARGFEKYLAEGKSPIPALDKLFAKFKEWLTEIYNGIKGSDIDIKLNKKMRDIYSQMLGVEIEEGKPKKEQVVDEVKAENSKKAFEALLKEESASPTAKKKASELKKEAGDKAVKEAAEIMENIDSIRQQLLDAGVIKSINCKWG